MCASISDGSAIGMSSRLAIVSCLGRSLGQTPASAKSESAWIHFVTPSHPRETVGRPTMIAAPAKLLKIIDKILKRDRLRNKSRQADSQKATECARTTAYEPRLFAKSLSIQPWPHWNRDCT
jgi:hypothetical protein